MMTQTMTAPVTQAQPTYEITKADRKRQERIAYAWQAYNGELEPPLKPMDDGTDDNVPANPCETAVNRSVDFLFGKELDIAVEKGASRDAQDAIDTFWGETEARVPLLQELGMNGAMAGTPFLRIMPDGAGNYEPVVVDPAIVVGMKTAPQNCNKVLLYCIQYSETEKDERGVSREVYYREEIAANYPESVPGKPQPSKPTSWSIQHWTQVSQKGAPPKDTAGWTSEGPPIAWNYPFPPMFHNKNLPMPNSPWGKPDITPVLIGINKGLNATQSDTKRTIRIYSNPLLWGVDIGESRIKHVPGEIIQLPLPTSKIDAVHIVSDVANALKFAADLRSDFDELSGVPGVATGRIATMPRGNLSGIAVELLHSPLTKKTDTKRCLYGKLIIDVSQALLVLNGMSGDIKITLAWQNPLPHDDLPSVQSAISKRELGISDTTLIRELGYDPEQEMKISNEEDAKKLQASLDRQAMLPPALPGAPALPGQPPLAVGGTAGAIGGKPAL